jgi:hypothetical protein
MPRKTSALARARREALGRTLNLIFPQPKEPHLLLNRGAKKVFNRDMRALDAQLKLFLLQNGPKALELYEAPEETRARSKVQAT